MDEDLVLRQMALRGKLLLGRAGMLQNDHIDDVGEDRKPLQDFGVIGIWCQEIFQSSWTERDGSVAPGDSSIGLGTRRGKLDDVVRYADLVESTDRVNNRTQRIRGRSLQDVLMLRRTTAARRSAYFPQWKSPLQPDRSRIRPPRIAPRDKCHQCPDPKTFPYPAFDVLSREVPVLTHFVPDVAIGLPRQ